MPDRSIERLPDRPAETANAVQVFLLNLSAEVEIGKARNEETKDILAKNVTHLTDGELQELENRLRIGDVPDAVKSAFLQKEIDELLTATIERREVLKRELQGFRPSPLPMNVEKPIDQGSPTHGKVHAAWEWTKEKAEGITEWAKENPTAAIAVASTLSLGLYGLWRFFRRKKPAQAGVPEQPKEKSSFLKKLAWIPLIGIAAYGIYRGAKYIDGKFQFLDAMQKQMMAMGERVQKGIQKPIDFIKNGFRMPETERYGLSPEDERQAEHLYDTRGEQDALPGLRQLFGLEAGQTSPQLEAFLIAMRAKYEAKKLPEGTVTYQRADVALNHYEAQMELGVQYLLKWTEDHPAEVVGATFIAAKLGLLRPILLSAKSAAEKAVAISATVAKWGIASVLRHPFLSVFAIGGSIIALRKAASAGKDIYLPENLQDLGSAFQKGEPIIVGANPSVEQKVEQMREHALAFVEAGDDFGPWVKAKFEDFLARLDEALPKMIGLTEQQIIENRNMAGLTNLQWHLEREKEEAGRSSQRKEAGEVARYEHAQEALSVFIESMQAERLSQVSQSDAPVRLLEDLRAALSSVGIRLTIEGGNVRWEQDGKPKADLCVDPKVRDSAELLRLSNSMRQGEEGDLSYVVSRMMQEARRHVNRSAETIEGPMFGSRIVAMTFGGFLYCLDIRNKDIATVIKVPLHMVFGLFADLDRDWPEYFANVGKGIVDTGLMSIPVVAFSRLKRLAIGGGNFFQFSKANFLKNITPGVADYFWVRNAIRGSKDVVLMKDFMHDRGIIAGYLRGRYMNTVLGKAGIRPEWIGIIETSSDFQQLDKVAAKLHIARLNKSDTPMEWYRLLRKGVMDKIKDVKIRQLSKSNFLIRPIVGTYVGEDFSVWKDTVQWYLKKNPSLAPTPAALATPPPIPGTPPPLPGAPGAVPATPATPPPAPGTASKAPPAAPAGSTSKSPTAGTPPSAPKPSASPATAPSVTSAPPTNTQTVPRNSVTTPSSRRGVPAENVPKPSITHEPISEELAGKFEQEAGGQFDEALKQAAGVAETVKEYSDIQELLEDIKKAATAKDEVKLQKLLSHPLLMQAAESGNPEAKALLRVSKWAKAGRLLSVTGKVLGVAGAILTLVEGGAYFFVQRPEMLKRLETSKDPDERQAIERELHAQPIQLGTNAVGTVLTFTPLMPVGLALVATSETGKFIRGSIEEATKYMTQDTQTLAKTSGGNILAEVAKSAPGKAVSEGQRFAANPLLIETRDMERMMETGNTLARETAYRAYFHQVASINLEPFRTEDLPELTSVQLANVNQEQTALFVNAAVKYVGMATEKTFVLADAEILRRAEAYARLLIGEWRINREYDSSLPNLGSRELEGIIKKELHQRNENFDRELQYLQRKNPVEFRKGAIFAILQGVQHDVNGLEQKLMEKNFSNITSWTGWWQWKSDEEFRSAARGYLVERLQESIETELVQPWADGSLDTATERVRTFMRKIGDLDQIAKDALSSDRKNDLVALGTPNRLTVGGMFDVLEGKAE